MSPSAFIDAAPKSKDPAAFDLGSLDEQPTFGDNVAFEVVIEKGGQRTVRRLLVLGFGEAADGRFQCHSKLNGVDEPLDIDCGIFGTLIKVLDEQNKEVSSSHGGVPMFIFGSGLYRASEVVAGVRARSGLTEHSSYAEFTRVATPDERKEIARGYISLYAMSLSLQSNKVFNKMLFESVEKPSLLSLIFEETTISIGERSDAPLTKTTWELGNSTLPAYRMPMRLLINGKEAMIFDLTVVPHNTPLGLCGGLVALEARHPTKADVKISVRLIGAHRGTGLEHEILKEPESGYVPPVFVPERLQ
jgi:hypothetical protein